MRTQCFTSDLPDAARSTQFNATSLPSPIFLEAATSFNGASQAGRMIRRAPRRPVVAGELAHHQRVLRPHRTPISCARGQSFPYGSAPRPAGEGYKAGFWVGFLFRSGRHAAFRDPKKACNSLSVGQEPRLHGPDRDPEAYSRGGIGKVSPTPNRCAFLPVEITKRKPGRVASRLVETSQSSFEGRNARVIEGSGREGQIREELPHRRFIHQSFHDAVDWKPPHQKLKES